MVARNRARRTAVLAVLGTLLLANLAVVPARALGLSFVVTTKGDEPDANPIDLACKTAGGQCSLRAAVMQANAVDPGTGFHQIRIGPIEFFMDKENTGGAEDAAEEGDYDILQNVRIVGAGSSESILMAGGSLGNGLDRFFDIRGNDIAVEISGFTLRFGDANGAPGGAIRATDFGQQLTLDDIVIEKAATSNGGVAISSRADLTITDSVIRNNSGRNATIEMDGGDLTISRSTISGNTTQLNASAFRLGLESVAVVDRTTISGNTSGTGGPILVGRSNADDSALTLRNSTIAGNTAPGAMIASFAEGVTTIRSSTIASNGGFGLDLDGPSSVKNTILAANSLGNCAVDPTSAGFNLDSGTSCGFDGTGDIEGGAAKLGTLADNGGPNRTMALGKGSDAIDAGSGCPTLDQRGVSRKDGDGDGEVRCDIGAYEAPKVSPPPTGAPTAAPTAVPTPVPTAEPTAVPSVAPASEAPPSEPAATLAPSGVPIETAAVASPGSSSTGPDASPVSSAEPAPVAGAEGSGIPLWVLLAIVLLVLLGALAFVLRRRRAT